MTRPVVSHAQRRALTLAVQRGTVAVSNCTDADLGYIDSRVAYRLIELGHLEQVGTSSHGQAVLRITGSGIELLDGAR